MFQGQPGDGVKDPDSFPTGLGQRLPRKDELPKDSAIERVGDGVFKKDGRLYTDIPTPPPPDIPDLFLP